MPVERAGAQARVRTPCPLCRRDTAHELYVSQAGWFKSSFHLMTRCGVCGKNRHQSAHSVKMTGETSGRQGDCPKCKRETVQVGYVCKDQGAVHWLCVTCGNDENTEQPPA